MILMRRSREVDEVHTTLIASVNPGLVAIQGVARGPDVSASPVTGTPCVYRETVLYQMQGAGRSAHFVEVARDTFAGPDSSFQVEDSSGRIPVIALGADFEITKDTFTNDGSAKKLGETAKAWITQYGFTWKDTFWAALTHKFKLEEQRIEEGSAVYVLGTVAPAEDELKGINPSNYMLCKGGQHSDFIIGSGPRAVVEQRIAAAARWRFVTAVALATVGIVFILTGLHVL